MLYKETDRKLKDSKKPFQWAAGSAPVLRYSRYKAATYDCPGSLPRRPLFLPYPHLSLSTDTAQRDRKKQGGKGEKNDAKKAEEDVTKRGAGGNESGVLLFVGYSLPA